MYDAYTVPLGATVTAGSQTFPFDPTVPGRDIGVPKWRPPSVDRANAIPVQPIQSAYTYCKDGSTACSTSAFCPAHEPLMSVVALTVNEGEARASGAAQRAVAMTVQRAPTRPSSFWRPNRRCLPSTVRSPIT